MIRDSIGYHGHPKGNVKGVAHLRRLARRDNNAGDKNNADTGVNPDQLNVELKSDGTVTIVKPGEKPKLIKPEAKASESPKPADKLEVPQPSQADNLKGVVTPAPESVFPKLESNPTVPKARKSPVESAPSKTKPAVVAPAREQKSEKLNPALKPTIKPGKFLSKPAPANP